MFWNVLVLIMMMKNVLIKFMVNGLPGATFPNALFPVESVVSELNLEHVRTQNHKTEV